MHSEYSKYMIKNNENTSCKTRKTLNVRKQTPINETVLFFLLT